MSMVKVTFPDGSSRSFERGTTPLKIAESLSQSLLRQSVAAKIDGRVVDLSFPIEKDATLFLLAGNSSEGLEVIRHSTAHLLAQAVKEIFPETLVTIGPVTEEGFYYDFDRKIPFTPEDLSLIEKKMLEIKQRKLKVERKTFDKKEAKLLFKKMGENYKLEILDSIPDVDEISAYQQGTFIDLCRGPHVPNTDRLGVFKLLSIAGAYWRGSENNTMLQRIYGTAFSSQKELDDELKRIEEAKKRDHRRLGPEMGLFTFLPVAPAMPFYLPKGTVLYQTLTELMRTEMRNEGYQEVICPQLMTTDLWMKSGHLENYKNSMYFVNPDDGQSYALKPMNCPGHVTLYHSTLHSYRDLPFRLSEFSKLHRFERGGVTHGVLRTRTFSQDDGHIFCTEDQIKDEALRVIRHTQKIYTYFGFDKIEVKLATRPQKFIGTVETWDRATKTLEESLRLAERDYSIVNGEGAFYGPKIEFHVRDSLNRLWQCATIQLDYALPERFALEYIDSSGQAQRPVMIHRAILGSFERFLGILIEHTGGHFPIWLCPTQAVILNVTDAQVDYATEIASTIRNWGMRVETDLRQEKLGYKIREAQIKKIPMMLVIGKDEVEKRTLSLRKVSGENLNNLTIDQFKKVIEPLLKPGGESH